MSDQIRVVTKQLGNLRKPKEIVLSHYKTPPGVADLSGYNTLMPPINVSQKANIRRDVNPIRLADARTKKQLPCYVENYGTRSDPMKVWAKMNVGKDIPRAIILAPSPKALGVRDIGGIQAGTAPTGGGDDGHKVEVTDLTESNVKIDDLDLGGDYVQNCLYSLSGKHIIQDALGVIHVTYTNGSPSKVYHGYSPDGGLT